MKFETLSGSVYEVDQDNKRWRRLSGRKPGTKRLGNDGEWRTYKEISTLEVGRMAIVYWGDDVAPIVPGDEPAAKTTITSFITKVIA